MNSYSYPNHPKLNLREVIFTNKNNNYYYFFYHYQVFKIKYRNLNTTNVCSILCGTPTLYFFNSHNIRSKYNYLMFNLPIFLPTLHQFSNSHSLSLSDIVFQPFRLDTSSLSLGNLNRYFGHWVMKCCFLFVPTLNLDSHQCLLLENQPCPQGAKLCTISSNFLTKCHLEAVPPIGLMLNESVHPQSNAPWSEAHLEG